MAADGFLRRYIWFPPMFRVVWQVELMPVCVCVYVCVLCVLWWLCDKTRSLLKNGKSAEVRISLTPSKNGACSGWVPPSGIDAGASEPGCGPSRRVQMSLSGAAEKTPAVSSVSHFHLTELSVFGNFISHI